MVNSMAIRAIVPLVADGFLVPFELIAMYGRQLGDIHPYETLMGCRDGNDKSALELYGDL
jgi:hypothetical protein